MTAPGMPIDPSVLHLPRGDLLLVVDVDRKSVV